MILFPAKGNLKYIQTTKFAFFPTRMFKEDGMIKDEIIWLESYIEIKRKLITVYVIESRQRCINHFTKMMEE